MADKNESSLPSAKADNIGISAEQASLQASAASLRASIAAREKSGRKEPDFIRVTNHERARLAELEAALQ